MDIPLRDSPVKAILAQGQGGDVDASLLDDCMAFLRVAKKSLFYFYARFDRRGLTPGKYSVLTELLAEPGQALSPSELALRLGISRPSVTSLIDSMVSQKLVLRKPATDDRRRMTVTLSAGGRRLIEQLLPDQYDSMASLVSFGSNAERRAFRRFLAQIEGEVDGRLAASRSNS